MKLGETLDMLKGWRDLEVLSVETVPVKDDLIEMGEGCSVHERSYEIVIRFATPLQQYRVQTRLDEQ